MYVPCNVDVAGIELVESKPNDGHTSATQEVSLIMIMMSYCKLVEWRAKLSL